MNRKLQKIAAGLIYFAIWFLCVCLLPVDTSNIIGCILLFAWVLA